MSPNFASIKNKDMKLFASNRSNHNKIGVSHSLQAQSALRQSALGQTATAPRQRTPLALRENIFLHEYKYIRCQHNKVSQKYHLLYNVLAPKLMQKMSLVDSKVQRDALQVL